MIQKIVVLDNNEAAQNIYFEFWTQKSRSVIKFCLHLSFTQNLKLGGREKELTCFLNNY